MKHLLLVLVLLSAASQRGPELQLNLVAAPPPPPESPEDVRRGGQGCGQAVGVVTDSPPTPPPFTVTLADTDRLAYEVGDTMSFNVIIENTSRAPLVLGMSRDPHVAPKTMQPCRVVPPGVHFTVALAAVRKTGGMGAIVAFGVAYYGSLDVPGTTLELQPGERVRVQLPAEVRPEPRMEPTLTTDPQVVRLKAFVMIEREWLQMEYSDNALPIELSQRRMHESHAASPATSLCWFRAPLSGPADTVPESWYLWDSDRRDSSRLVLRTRRIGL